MKILRIPVMRLRGYLYHHTPAFLHNNNNQLYDSKVYSIYMIIGQTFFPINNLVNMLRTIEGRCINESFPNR